MNLIIENESDHQHFAPTQGKKRLASYSNPTPQFTNLSHRKYQKYS